jgi:hypothetical protein
MKVSSRKFIFNTKISLQMKQADIATPCYLTNKHLYRLIEIYDPTLI